MKITIIGSSVALRIRPNYEYRDGQNYGQLIEKTLSKTNSVQMSNLSLSRMLITEIEFQLDYYIRTFPDLYIINLGAVDAPNREISRWYSDRIFKRKSKMAYTVFNWFHKVVITNFRKPLVRLRGHRPWVSMTAYANCFENVIKTLQKETNARIIVLGINKGNHVVDQKLPGTVQNYIRYNNRLKELCARLEVSFVDTADLKSEDFFPDGVHYNQVGHELIAKRILEVYEKG